MTYHDLPGVNFSTLKHIARSPAHYLAAKRAPFDADALRLGRAVHTLALEPHRFQDQYVRWETRRQGKAWEAFEIEHADRTILTGKQWDDAFRMDATLQRLLAPYLPDGVAEEVVTWTDDVTGLPCKARRDLRCGSTLIEVKTAVSLPDGCQHRQYAARLDRLEAACLPVEQGR